MIDELAPLLLKDKERIDWKTFLRLPCTIKHQVSEKELLEKAGIGSKITTKYFGALEINGSKYFIKCCRNDCHSQDFARKKDKTNFTDSEGKVYCTLCVLVKVKIKDGKPEEIDGHESDSSEKADDEQTDAPPVSSSKTHTENRSTPLCFKKDLPAT